MGGPDRAIESPPPGAAGAGRRRRLKRRRDRRDRRGVALVMVLGAVTVLTVFLTELQEETSAELSAALAERDALRAEYYARSGIHLSRLLIASESTIRTAIGPMLALVTQGKMPSQIPVWNFSDMILGPFNDQLSAAAFGGSTGMDLSTGKNLGLTGGGRFELKIIDEESKINVNLGAKGNVDVGSQLRLASQLTGLFGPPQYNPIFEDRDADGQFSDRASICGAIVDWADWDEALFPCDISATAGPSTGVEDNFYQTIGLDYRRKNAAFDSLEELRLVRGMSDDFWATFVDPEPGSPEKRTMTVWGKPEATVNVNTAAPQILLALVCGSAVEGTPLCTNIEQMSTFLSVLTLAKGFIPGGLLFPDKTDFYAAITQAKKPMIGAAIGGMLQSMGVEPVKLKVSKKEFLKTISNETKFLSVYAEGVVPGNKRETRVRIHAVLDIQGAQPPGEGNNNVIPPTGGGSGSGTSLGEVPEGAYEQQVRANPAGTVVYWRIE
ncbi:MAG: general secretion pathway protein GspK [Polyangiaceae bacterium]|nr:general secretion pathway protein GspK [Polyangiaceae bacterium]